MSYPDITGAVLQSLGYGVGDFSLEKSKTDGLVLAEWYHADPKPTEADITTTAASQPFLDWEAEHGGDPDLTARRIAKEAISTPAGKLVVALVSAMRKQGVITGTKAQIVNAILAEIDLGEAD